MAIRLLEPRAEYGETFTRVPNTVALDESLSGLAKATYLALASFAWQEGECWPSQMALARRAGISRRQVIRCLEELRQAGYIEQNESEQRATLTYRLLPVREQQPRTLRPAAVPYSTDESETEGCATQSQGYDSQAQGVCHTVTGGYDCVAHEEYSDEINTLTNARTREIDEPIRRVLAAFGMTEAPWSVNAISEKLAGYEETHPGLDAVAEAEGLRSESDAEGRKHGNWLARWDGWMRTASQRQERIKQSPPPQSTPSQPERIPLPVEPVDCPEVPAWGKLVNHLYGQFQAKRGQAPAEHPRAWTIFGCRPLPANSTNAVLALETHEPPDVAAELAKDVRWWLAGACLGGMQVQVTSRWAS